MIGASRTGPAATVEPVTVPAPSSSAVRPPVLDRLSRRSARLIALEGEDHYVRVHTDAGSELVLMRLADAIAETAPVEGLQVHRSWWVARDAVQRIERNSRTLRLSLDNGITAPVARNHAARVRAEFGS